VEGGEMTDMPKWKTIHLSQSITGPLKNWTLKEWKAATEYITRTDGSRFTVDQLKEAFVEELAKGHKVIPIGECDNFDWEHGCRGHAHSEGDADIKHAKENKQ
jgi:hypothetical protein